MVRLQTKVRDQGSDRPAQQGSDLSPGDGNQGSDLSPGDGKLSTGLNSDNTDQQKYNKEPSQQRNLVSK